MKNYMNPLVLEGHDINAILDFQKRCNPYIQKIVAIEKPFDVRRYQNQYRGETTENIKHMVQHHCAKNVIYAVHAVQLDTSLLRYMHNVAEKIGIEYGKVDESMRKNPNEMLQLVAYRADAIYLVDKSIFDKDFLEKAIQYNPQVYHMLPYELQQSQAVIDVYRDTVYKTGPKSHPVFLEIQQEIEMELASLYGKDKMSREDWEKSDAKLQYEQDFALSMPTPQVNTSLTPAYMAPEYVHDKLFSVSGYEQIFTHVLLNLRNLRVEHEPNVSPIDTDKLNKQADNRLLYVHSAIQYLAICRQTFPELSERFDEVEIKAYQQHKNQIKQQTHDVYMKTQMAEFCIKHGLSVEPEWQREFTQLNNKINPLQVDTLKRLQQDIDDAQGNRYNTLQCMPDVFCAMRDCPSVLVQKLLNTEDFWTDIGRHYAELEKELHTPNISKTDREYAQKDIESIKAYVEGQHPLLKQIAPYIEAGRQGQTQEYTGPVIGE